MCVGIKAHPLDMVVLHVLFGSAYFPVWICALVGFLIFRLQCYTGQVLQWGVDTASSVDLIGGNFLHITWWFMQ